MTQTPILAAGGIVIRGGPKPLIAVVQRRKDNDWVLPKGKLKRRERAIAAARREVIEETGHKVFVHEYLGAISYDVGGRPKVVQFWRMQAAGPAGEFMREIRAVEWLPLQSAVERLSRPLEQLFLSNIGRQAVKLNEPSFRKRRSARKDRIARRGARKAPISVEHPTAAVEPPVRRNLLQRLSWRFRSDAAAGTAPTMLP